ESGCAAVMANGAAPAVPAITANCRRESCWSFMPILTTVRISTKVRGLAGHASTVTPAHAPSLTPVFRPYKLSEAFRNRTMLVKSITAFLFCCCPLAHASGPGYTHDVQPILKKNCSGCHQPASKSSGLDLTNYDGFRTGGKRGPAFVPGSPETSNILRFI